MEDERQHAPEVLARGVGDLVDVGADVAAPVDGVGEQQAAVGHDVHDHHGADDAEHDPGVPAVGEALQLRDEPEVHEGRDARDDPEDHHVLEQVVAVAEGAEQGVGALRVEDEEVEALVEAAAHEDDRAEQQRREAREDEVVRDARGGVLGHLHLRAQRPEERRAAAHRRQHRPQLEEAPARVARRHRGAEEGRGGGRHADDGGEHQRAPEDARPLRPRRDGQPLPDVIEPVLGLPLRKQDEAPEGAHGKQPYKPSDKEGHRDGVHVRRP